MQDCAVSDAVVLLGTDERRLPMLALRAGPLSVDIRGVHLHSLRAWDHEVWHGAAFLFRDPDWLTPDPVVVAHTLTQHNDRFQLVLHGVIEAAEAIDFSITIDGDRSGRIRYLAEAVPRADLATNRCGVVVMHPLSCAGQPVEFEHTDGRVSQSTFPELIAPWPPFTLVRAVRHTVMPGVQAICRLEGDAFEFEDQRNNADASFKTYNRSNQAPRPYRLRAGVAIRQSVDLRVEGHPARGIQPDSSRAAPAGSDEQPGGPSLQPLQALSVRPDAPAAPLPALGVGITPGDTEAWAALAPLCARLSPAFLHLGLHLPDEPVNWAGLSRLMSAGGSALRIDLDGMEGAGAEARLLALAARLRQAGIRPASVALLPASPDLLQAARRAFPGTAIGAGTPHFFVQLNRMEVPAGADFLSFTVSGVVHDTDEKSIMAGHGSAPGMMATLRARHGPVPVHVGPSRVGARGSPLGRQPDSDGRRRLTLARRDPRDGALFGATWAFAHFASHADAGAAAITLFTLQGDGGLVDLSSARATTRPAFDVLAGLAGEVRRREIMGVDPSRLAALALERDGQCQWWLGNLRAEPLEVTIVSRHGVAAVEVLDLTALRQKPVTPGLTGAWRKATDCGGTLRLPAWATARVRMAGRW